MTLAFSIPSLQMDLKLEDTTYTEVSFLWFRTTDSEFAVSHTAFALAALFVLPTEGMGGSWTGGLWTSWFGVIPDALPPPPAIEEIVF